MGMIFMSTNKREIEWFPVKSRPLTKEEERLIDLRCIYEGSLPPERTEVLVTCNDGTVTTDYFASDAWDWYYDEGEIIAWAYMPERYENE
jgi:hypothetical protein